MMADTPLCGPYGESLLPQVVEAIAETDPSRVWASIPISSDVTDGFQDITFKEMLHAIDFICWWIEDKIGSSRDFETVAYLGPSDMRYSVMLVATMKCRYQSLFPSGRNSASGNLSLLEETRCKTFFHSDEFTSKIVDLKKSKPDLKTFTVPSFSQMLTRHTKSYPYQKKFSEAILDPALICHTSGSTGAPKPIYLPHGTFSVLDNHRRIPKVLGRKNQDYALFDFENGGRFYTSFPPFHAAGLHVYAAVPVFYNCTLVLGPPTKPPSGELVSQIMKLQRLKSVYTAPAVLEGLVIERGGLEQASQLDFVMFSGGPLSPSAGDSLSKVTDVCQVIGQTETAIIPALVPERDRWSYFEWQPFYGVRMEPDGDDLYEMVIRKNLKLSMFQTVCYTFPDIQEWRTKDLFAQHPEHPELWRFHGRKDDIIVLSNGEKFNPVTMEGIILGSPLLSGALIVGTARFQAALLIEAKEHVVMSADELIEEVWPFVQRANDYGPAHAQIFRTKIGVANRDKPFQRAGKGTVVRSKTNDEYSDEIEGLYSHAATYQEQGLPELKKPYSKENVALWVRTCMAQFLTVPDGEDLDTADFFVLGLDSLKTAELINAFKSCLESDLDERRLELITPKAIYANPNLESLSTFLYGLLNPESSPQNGAVQTQVTRAEHMEAMIRRHTADLPQRKTAVGGINGVNSHLSPKTLTVALTGSTGSLGSTLLENLLADPKISKIYCLNRTADAQDRQQKNFKVRGLQPDLSKATFIKAEFGLPQIGIPDSTFQALKENVDVIIHNAWKVDFNHPLSSFEAVHIHGVRHLIDWSLASRRHPRIYFVSSVSSVGNWAALRGASMPVPEEIQTDHDVAMHQGYGESKHVAEGILAGAAGRAGVPCTILRIGQIAGPLEGKGTWNEREWVPSLIRTSRAMGLLPDRLLGIDWIPVDRLSSIILELIHAGSGGPDNHNSGEDTIQVFNLVNPHVTEWSDLIPPILKRFGPSLKIVPLKEWIQGLRGVGASELEEKPAAKIIEFFEGMEGAVERGEENRYVTTNGEGASWTMRELEGVGWGWMDKWLRQWGF